MIMEFDVICFVFGVISLVDCLCVLLCMGLVGGCVGVLSWFVIDGLFDIWM